MGSAKIIKKMRRKKIIRVPSGMVQRLIKETGMSEVSVYNALAYRSDSASAQAIRKKALTEYGGVATTKICFD